MTKQRWQTVANRKLPRPIFVNIGQGNFFTQPVVAMVVTNIRDGQFVKHGFRMMFTKEDEDSLDYDLTFPLHTLLHTSDKLDLVNHK